MSKPWGKRKTATPSNDASRTDDSVPTLEPLATAADIGGQGAQSSSSRGSKAWNSKRAKLTTAHTATPAVEPPAPAEPSHLRGVLKSHFLGNKMSGKDAATVAAAALHDGAHGTEDWAKAAQSLKNAARDLLKVCLRGCEVPTLYFAPVRLKDPSTGLPVTQQLPFILPHEALAAIIAKASAEEKARWLHHETRQQDIQKFCDQYGRDPACTYGLGLHGDGVPFAAKMRDSIEQFSWSFASDCTSPRTLSCVAPKSCCDGRNTYEDILGIFKRSLDVMSTGCYQAARLDGSAWARPQDSQRAKLVGPLGCSGCLVELRGDWQWYSSVFAFPSWANTSMCWCCEATQQGATSFRDTGSTAAWRSKRMTAEQFLEQQRRQGVAPSIIFSAPCVSVRYVKVDWLHCVDLGVSQTILGNALWETCSHLPGTSMSTKVAQLWLRMKAWYKQTEPSSEFQQLTETMLRQPGKGPRLRGKAGECRYLVPFVLQLTWEFAHKSRHAAVVHEVVAHLNQLYRYLDIKPFPAAGAAQECQTMCNKMVALHLEAQELGRDKHWPLKPKLHMLQELLEFDCMMHGQSPRFF